MRILIVTPLIPPESGGPSYYSVALKEALEKKGEDVDLIAFKEVRKYPSGIRHLLFLYKVLWRARNVDALIILDTVSVALPAVIAGWVLNKKMIVRVGGDFVWERYVERIGEKVLLREFYLTPRALTKKERLLIALQKRIVLRLATCVVFNTEWLKNIWNEPYALLHKRSVVIENMFIKSESSSEMGNPNTNFLFVGRAIAVKNLSTLKTASDLARSRKGIGGLTVLEHVPRETFFSYLDETRAVVIPSLSEVAPNVALEALAHGVPVILTRECGAYELLKDVAVWIDPLDAEEIAQKLELLLDAQEYAKVLERVRTFSYKHTYEDIAEEFLALCV